MYVRCGTSAAQVRTTSTKELATIDTTCLHHRMACFKAFRHTVSGGAEGMRQSVKRRECGGVQRGRC